MLSASRDSPTVSCDIGTKYPELWYLHAWYGPAPQTAEFFLPWLQTQQSGSRVVESAATRGDQRSLQSCLLGVALLMLVWSLGPGRGGREKLEPKAHPSQRPVSRLEAILVPQSLADTMCTAGEQMAAELMPRIWYQFMACHFGDPYCPKCWCCKSWLPHSCGSDQ